MSNRNLNIRLFDLIQKIKRYKSSGLQINENEILKTFCMAQLQSFNFKKYFNSAQRYHSFKDFNQRDLFLYELIHELKNKICSISLNTDGTCVCDTFIEHFYLIRSKYIEIFKCIE